MSCPDETCGCNNLLGNFTKDLGLAMNWSPNKVIAALDMYVKNWCPQREEHEWIGNAICISHCKKCGETPSSCSNPHECKPHLKKEYKKLADIIAKSVCKNEAFAWEDGAQTAKEFLLDKINEEEIIAILRQNFEKETKFKRADIAKAILKYIKERFNLI